MAGRCWCWSTIDPRVSMFKCFNARARLILCSCFCAACGGFIELNDNDPPGYITSPNYPENYPQNIDCIWVVTVPNGESVRIDFEDEFYIEPSSRYSSPAPIQKRNHNILKGLTYWSLLWRSFVHLNNQIYEIKQLSSQPLIRFDALGQLRHCRNVQYIWKDDELLVTYVCLAQLYARLPGAARWPHFKCCYSFPSVWQYSTIYSAFYRLFYAAQVSYRHQCNTPWFQGKVLCR